MHRHHHDVPTYTGAGLAYPPQPAGHGGHGFCNACCHPASKCCCHRECRKESREILAQSTEGRGDIKDARLAGTFARASAFATVGAIGQPNANEPEPKAGAASAFIGGACCVYLSIEYVPSSPTATSQVIVLVEDGEGTMLGWGRKEQPGAGYTIKECIITTKPGADLSVAVMNMTARVRWCEIFSC